MKVHFRHCVGFFSTSFSFHICPQCASGFLPCICVSSYFWLPVLLCLYALACARTWSLMLSVCEAPGRCCLYKHRMWWRSAGEPGGSGKAWASPDASTHTHTNKHTRTATEAGSSKSYAPLGDARTHTGRDTQEEGAASAALIKTVAAYLSLPLTRGTVKEKKHRKYRASQINTACC